MAKVNPELVELFCAKAAIVGATVFEAASMDAAVTYVLDVCQKKTPCEMLAEEAGAEKGPLSENKQPTRTQRMIAVPGMDEPWTKALSKACASKGYVCMKDGLRNHLAGIDIGIAPACLGVADSGTCVVVSDEEQTRLSTMICEISMLVLRKSDIRKDLPSIAADLRALQGVDQPTYTAFITGPSRTADIERVLAIGVHGPLELHIILLEG
ncbi:MAG: lactate utilization protein [Desulfovibrionaceae bacterium]